MSVSYIPDVTESGEVRGFYAVARDITELRAAERRERQRMLELAHVSRFASMGAMATEIAHEVNQPLAAIAMYSAACLRTLAKGGDTAVVTGWLTSINAQAKRVGEVVQRLRQFLQMGGAERAPIGMNEVVREVAGLASVEARAQDVDLLVDLAPELPAVLADRILLEQVVLNLVRNALDAVGQQTGPRRVVVQTRPAGEGVEVSVADNGPGVPAGLGRNVFDSFVSSKPGALGMGLAVSRSIVEAHEGGISYTNNPEGGSTFRFTLPSASV
jgi:C4-dicarboxylate-specific signal transduction histidine kinase